MDPLSKSASATEVSAISQRFPWVRHVSADASYAGHKLKDALRPIGKWTIEIVKRSDIAAGFEVLPRPVGSRANPGLAQSQSAPRQGLREHRRVCHRLALHRFDLAFRETNRPMIFSF